MKKFVYCKVIISLILCVNLYAQDNFTNLKGKTASQVGQIVSGVTVPNKTFFDNLIFQRIMTLVAASMKRGITPDDYNGSINDAWTAASDSSTFLLIPADYSTDSTITWVSGKAPYIDLRNGIFDYRPEAILFTSNYTNMDSVADKLSRTSALMVVVDNTISTVTSKTISTPLYFTSQGKITVNTGDTLTISSTINADPEQQIFSDNGGEVRMPGYHIYAKWFGAQGDGVTEDHVAIQWAADALRGESQANVSLGTWGTLEFAKGKYIVNPTDHLTFLPDSGRTLYIIGQGEGTVFTNRDFCSYGDVFGDFIVNGNAHNQGHVWYRDFVIDSTHQGDSDGAGGNNAFGTVRSQSTFENITIKYAGNRAMAWEGMETTYTYPGNGFRDIYVKNVRIYHSWKNAISINKHHFSLIETVRLEDVYIDDYSRIVPDSAGQGTGYASPGIQLLARAAAYNPGHDFYLTRVTIKNGYSNALEVNGLKYNNNLFIKDLIVENCNVDSATTPAGVLITDATNIFVDGLYIHNTVGGPAWRDRTTNSVVNITNALIDSTTAGTARGYAFDLFGTDGYMISNSRILDNERGFFINNTGSKWGWLSNSHIRGDTLGYYTYEFDIRDVMYTPGTLIEEKLDGGYATTGQNIIYNGRFKADSSNVVMSPNGDGLPDGWQIYFTDGSVDRDSVITYIEPDSGLVIRNISSQAVTFILRQNVSARLSGSDTYTVNVEVNTVSGGGANTLRTWINAGPVGSNLAAGLNQSTSQSITSFVGIGRTAGMAANSFIIIDYIEALVE